MKKITVKLLLSLGIATIPFSLFLFYQAVTLTNRHVKEVVEQEALMALKFDLAIRKYIAENVRPVMYELLGPDAFMPETMSTSYVARSIFEDVRSEFPDYIIKFSSGNPRNPLNNAGPEELKVIEYLNNNPQSQRWEGAISVNGKPYIAKFSAMRMEESCLHCHSNPDDAPTALLERYGSIGGFYRPLLGQVIGLDTVAIPMAKISEKLWLESLKTFLVSALGLLLFFIAIVYTTRFVITNRLSIISRHFKNVAQQEDYLNIDPIEIKGKDEIFDLVFSFNNLSDKLKHFYSSLEIKVRERTRELEDANERLKQEIGERKRVEEALRESEATLRSIFRAAPTGIGMVAGRIIKQANDRFFEITGYKSEELLGKSAMILYPTVEDFEFVGQKKYNQIRERGTGTVETRWKRKDGKIIDILLSSTPIDPYDLSAGVTFTALDITARKRAEEGLRKAHDELEIQVMKRTVELVSANEQLKKEINERKKSEEALQESEEKYRSLFQGAANPITILDREGIIIMINNVGAGQLGLEQNECLGKSIFEIIPDLDDSYHELYRKVIDKGREVTKESFLKLPSGTKWFWSSHQPVANISGIRYGVQIISYDITERKKAEDALRTSLREKEVLLSEIHHRVKNNFEIISSLLYMSSKQTKNRKIQNLYKNVHGRIHSMALIHDQLYQNDRFDRVDMGKHLRSLADYLASIYSGTGRDITTIVEPSEVYLSLNQAIPCALALNELIVNSHKHAFRTRTKGTIHVSIDHSAGGDVFLKVKDDGDGLSERNGIGNAKGIGLKLVRHLIEGQLKGEIHVDSNNGTEFQIEFKKVEL